MIQLTKEEFLNAAEGACPFHGVPLMKTGRCPKSELQVLRVNKRGALIRYAEEPTRFWPAPR